MENATDTHDFMQPSRLLRWHIESDGMKSTLPPCKARIAARALPHPDCHYLSKAINKANPEDTRLNRRGWRTVPDHALDHEHIHTDRQCDHADFNSLLGFKTWRIRGR